MLKELLNKYVMVRTYSAGVHYGILDKVSISEAGGIVVKLKESRRVHSWTGACSLSQLATEGPKKEGSRISVIVPSIYLTAIEVIEMTELADKNLSKKIWKI